ncbi:hypothetical protein D3C81_1769930 [compost metagenome]
MTAWVSSPGAPRMRGFTPSLLCAASSAWAPRYLPSGETPPTTLLVVSASVSPSATRTTIVRGLVCAAIAAKLRYKVPVLPALPMAASTLVTSTGVSSGKAAGSASSAVAIRPSTAVDTVRIGREPSLISMTRTPWW